MCRECKAIDKKISHYREMEGMLTDELTREALKQLIAKLEVDKEALHPAQ